jgi:protein-S-isoprenylcysteine O-methyltransferase Ste14
MGPTDQRVDDIAVARGLARPPLLFLACLALGFALDRLLPLPLTFAEVTLICWTCWTVGGGLIVVGLAIAAAGIRNFFHADTPVPSNQPVRALVTTGIHAWSRNPIYVGMLLLYAGIGMAARSPWVLILAVPIVVILRYVVVVREETYLERRFGDAYRDYKARVRRWL